MTTLAYQNGTLYADSKAYGGDKTPLGSKTKIHRLADGIFAGTSTNVGSTERLLRMLKEEGMAGPTLLDLAVDAFYVQKIKNDFRPNEKKYSLWAYFGGPAWIQLDENDTHFLGSGSSYAMGANCFSRTVEDAMLAAFDLDLWSARPLQQSHVWSA